MRDLKAAILENITSTKIICHIVVSNESKVRFVISNAAPGNTIVVRGRITGQDDFDTLATITGSDKVLVTVKTYDEIQVDCTVYSSLSNYVKVVASSFNEAGGSTTFDAPTGGQIEQDLVHLNSSDGSVVIVNDPLTGTIDFTVVPDAASKYIKTFLTTDWVLNGSFYELTVLSATHGKINPVVQNYETIAGIDDVVYPEIIRNGSNDITIQVTQTPDNRYNGKLIIL